MKKMIGFALVIISICIAIEAFVNKSLLLWYIYYDLEIYTLAYFSYFISKRMSSKYKKAIFFFLVGILSHFTYVAIRTVVFSIQVKGFFVGILGNELKYSFPLPIWLTLILFIGTIFVMSEIDGHILKSEENNDDFPDQEANIY